MKRNPQTKPARSGAKARTLAPDRLTGVRGGVSLGIRVEVTPPPAPIMQMQHNETLIAL